MSIAEAARRQRASHSTVQRWLFRLRVEGLAELALRERTPYATSHAPPVSAGNGAEIAALRLATGVGPVLEGPPLTAGKVGLLVPAAGTETACVRYEREQVASYSAATSRIGVTSISSPRRPGRPRTCSAVTPAGSTCTSPWTYQSQLATSNLTLERAEHAVALP